MDFKPLPVNIAGSRPLQTIVEALAAVLAAESPVENDTDNSIRFRVSRDNVTPDPFTVEVTTTNASPTITGEDLSSLRPGDAIAGTNITGTVTAVDTTVTPNTATISANATGSGTETVDVTPPTFDLALYDIETVHTMTAGSPNITVTVKVYSYDGTTAEDGNGNGKDDSTTTSTGAAKVQEFTFTIDLDRVLSNARVART